MISKNFIWFCVLIVSLIALILNTMYQNWLLAVIMILPIAISYKQYIKYRLAEQ